MIAVTEPGLVRDLSENAYHSDPVEGGSLSSTGAKRILEAPAVYQWHQQNPEPHKAAYDFGTAVHSLVLGTGALPEDHGFKDLRTKAAQEKADEIRGRGNVPMNAKEIAEIQACADAVLDHPIAGPMFKRDDVESEVSAFAPYEGEWLRSRMDLLIPKSHIIVDLKTAAGDVSPKGFTKTVIDFGYDVSLYHYRLVYRIIHGVEPTFIHVAVSKKAPHLVAVHQLDKEFIDFAESRWSRAFARYKHGRTTGEWPGLPPIIHQISPPAWAVYHEEDLTEAEESTP